MSARSIKKAGVMLAGWVCVAIGLALAWHFISPAALAQVRTLELMGVLGLLALPAMTLAAVVALRRSRADEA